MVVVSVIATFALTLSLAWIYIRLNQESVKKTVIAIANNTTNGDWSLDKVSITIFRHFPKVSLELSGLGLYDVNSADSSQVLDIGAGYVALDIVKALKGSVDVTNVTIDSLIVNAKQDSMGIDLVRAISLKDTTSSDTTTSSYMLNLQDITLLNSNIKFSQATGERYQLSIDRLKSFFYDDADSLSLNIELQSQLDSLSTFMPLEGKNLLFNGYVNYVRSSQTANIQAGELDLGILKLLVDGTIALDSIGYTNVNASMAMRDIGAIGIDNKGLISAEAKGDGSLNLSIGVSGKRGERLFSGNVDGSGFVWLVNGKKVEDIETKLSFRAKLKDPQNYLMVDRLKARYGNNFIDLRSQISNFMEPNVTLASKGKVDLAQVVDLLGLDVHTKGEFDLDADLHSQWDKNYMLTQDSGYIKLDVQNFAFHHGDSVHLIDTISGNFIFERDTLKGRNINIAMGPNKIKVGMIVDNVMNYFLGNSNRTMLGMRVSAPHFNPSRIARAVVSKEQRAQRRARLKNPQDSMLIAARIDSIRQNAIDDVFFDCGLIIINNSGDKFSSKLSDYEATFKMRDFRANPLIFAPISQFSGDVILRRDSLIIPFARGVLGRSDIDLSLEMNGLRGLFMNPSDTTNNIHHNISVKLNSKEVYARDIFTLNRTFLLPRQMVNERIQGLKFDATLGYNLRDLVIDNALSINIRNLEGATPMYPLAISNVTLNADMNSSAINLKQVTAKVGDSDIMATGKIDIRLSERDTTFMAEFGVKSDFIDLDQIMSTDFVYSSQYEDQVIDSLEWELLTDTTLTTAAIDQKLKALSKRENRKKKRQERKSDSSTRLMNSFTPENKTERTMLTEVTADDGSQLNVLSIHLPQLHLSVDVGRARYMGLELEQISGNMKIDTTNVIALNDFTMQNDGGDMELSGKLVMDSITAPNIRLDGKMKVQNLNLSNLDFEVEMEDSENFSVGDHFKGRVDGAMDLNLFITPELEVLSNDMYAQIDATIRDGAIVNFAPMLAMSSYFRKHDLSLIRFGSMSNVFTIEKGVMKIPRMNVASTIGNIYIAGEQSFEGNMDYTIEVPWQVIRQAAMSTIFGGKKKEGQEEIIQEATDKKYLSVQIKGTSDDFDVKVGKNKNNK